MMAKGHLPDPLVPESPEWWELGLQASKGLCSRSQRICESEDFFRGKKKKGRMTVSLPSTQILMFC